MGPGGTLGAKKLSGLSLKGVMGEQRGGKIWAAPKVTASSAPEKPCFNGISDVWPYFQVYVAVSRVLFAVIFCQGL